LTVPECRSGVTDGLTELVGEISHEIQPLVAIMWDDTIYWNGSNADLKEANGQY